MFHSTGLNKDSPQRRKDFLKVKRGLQGANSVAFPQSFASIFSSLRPLRLCGENHSKNN
jgi:hypothetical protein